jgi:uncharacterized 2Fe-2S/4Fe-4S cluster protein (DUF4445 family)
VTLQVGQWETVILTDHSRFEFTPREGLGIAVDLGTTTIAAQLLDLQSGRVLGVCTELNPQTIHGSDVMSRVQLAVEGGQGGKLVDELRQAIGDRLVTLVASTAIEGIRVQRIVLVGNTVMHHLFGGIDLEPLSHWPFESPALGSCAFPADELGWRIADNPTVRFLPCLGGFVGSDLLAGVLATGMHRGDAPMVLVDLGTNGEILIGNRERILCASTAAGPAFEGGRISMGMRATTGAISEVTIDEGELRVRTVGEVEPRGICGSGLVDAVAAGLELGLIRPDGRLTQPGRPLELAPGVILTQGDIRELQLAKAAIAAGIKILRRNYGVGEAEGPPIHLAGAFGNYVNRGSAHRIGLFDVPEQKIWSVGNTALLGAKIALFAGQGEDEDFGEVRERIGHVSLAADPLFQEIFVQEMAFPE